jgi:multiple antibiotic resistance protein
MITEAALVSFIAALFSMMNPIGNLGLFASLTRDRSGGDAVRVAWSCAFASAITLLVVAWYGAQLMGLFGITVDSMRAAGGVIVLMIGLQMLMNVSAYSSSATELIDARSRDSIAIVPLAIPIVAGPGTMATVLLATQQHSEVLSKLEISAVIASMSAFTGLLFSFATPISRWLGASGMGVVTRVTGLILASIAMRMLAEGLKGLLPGLA